MKPLIHISVMRPDGRASNVSILGDQVTSTMLKAAEDLLDVLSTGEPAPLPDDLYEVIALAFGTTRTDAKDRLIGAMYGKRGKKVVR